tara:strand:- start:4171 stop:5211 length:1041 start_codon:yes stop_codon:yes gene_type:complete
MARTQRNFIAGRMNKSLDERLIPNGEYEDALNVRLGSTEASEIGSVENAKGNSQLTSLFFLDQTHLSENARTIGAFEDSSNETIYWFVHDPTFTLSNTGKCDMICSFNTTTALVTYHVVSTDNGFGVNTTLNFNPTSLITSINLAGKLLFFTDNLNPPRFINIENDYAAPLLNGSPPPGSGALWKFKAGKSTIGGFDFIGFHQGTLFGCPTPNGNIGEGVSPTTTQIPLPGVDCYTDLLGLPTTKGYGIQGGNTANNLALTQFSTDVSTGTTSIGLINSNIIGNPGSSGINGNIIGDDGNSGIWSVNYSSIVAYTDGNGNTQQPESGGTVNLIGLTLTENVTYTLT